MNVQSRNCCWSNKCSNPSTIYTKGCEQEWHNISERKKQHSTISTKAQRSSPWGQTTCRNLNFALFALIFLYCFLILHDLNRKHTNFQLNWTEDVAHRNATIFSTKFKAPSRLRVRCLRSGIWASSHGQTQIGWVWLDEKFDSTQFFFKKYLNPSSYAKVMTILPKHVRVTVLEGRI
jgi:hypothetical protein